MDAALLGSIQKGKGLKKVDRSQIKDASGPAIEGPSFRQMSKIKADSSNTGKTSSGGGGGLSAMSSGSGGSSAPPVPGSGGAPQLGGLFAGGMPTLKKTGAPGASTMLGEAL